MKQRKAKKKIGPNDPCPCGSGKKYKKCCRGKEDDPTYYEIANFPSIYKEMRKNARFKECIFPDHTHCSEKVIGAHAIQNTKILKRIADDGIVYMPIPKPDNPFNLITEYGRKEATVFTGFGSYHDKTVFQPIEDSPFQGTDEQVFLYTYRTFALDYHKKQEVVRMQQEMFSNKPSIVDMPGLYTAGQTPQAMAVNDYLEEKKLFDDALNNHDYSVLTSFVWSFDGFSNFAAVGGEAPSLDFQGNQIQDLTNPNVPARHIYITVFPEGEKTYAIIAWFKQYDGLFSSIGEKLKSLSDDEKKNYINNTLPIITENIAIRPSAWAAMNIQSKNAFLILFAGLAQFIEADGKKYDRLEKATFDLFSL